MLRIIALICLARGSLGLSFDSTNLFNEREIHGTLNTSKLNERIMGGTISNIRLYPYTVSVHYQGKHTCGGSIIGPDMVLSAAHCFVRPHRFYTVRMGHTYNYGGIVHSISHIIKHPKFKKRKLFSRDYDVVLVRLSENITFSETMQPVKLQRAKDKDVAAGTMAVATGWGSFNMNGKEASKQLREIKLPIISDDECKKIYVNFTERMMCTFSRGDSRNVHHGDSGGPLVANGKQVGIVSFSACCEISRWSYPGGYMKVAAFRRWINGYTD